MIPILYQTITEGTVPTDYGLGSLTDCLKAEVKEERNGIYELTLEYAAEGIHAEDIQPNRFIKVKPNATDNPQLLRIYKVGKAINGRFEILARHIGYDLSGKVITGGSAGSCVEACALLQSKAGNFTINTDKTVSAPFSVSEPSSVRSWFGGKQGSLLDVYGGEWKYDNYTASLLQSRGTDRGVYIRYGKNLTELNQDVSIENLATGIVPFFIDTNGNKTVGTKVSTGLVLDVDRDLAIDFSQDVDPESSTPIATQLANLANRYIANNDLTNVFNNITLNFVQLEGLTERVDLCDTVHIVYEPLGITATAKCIATVWDVLNERYIQTTFGSAKTNIADTIATQAKEVSQVPSKSFMNEAITRATELITGNLGGYVILHDADGDGKPDEILIMNTEDPATATEVWRWNKSGLAYGNSYSGPFSKLALTSDGQIVATAITSGTLNADLIKAGTISDTQGNSSINMTNGQATLYQLKAKGNFTLVDSSDNIRAYLSHTVSDGSILALRKNSDTNICAMWTGTNGGQFYLYNTAGDPRVRLFVGNSNAGILYLINSSDTATITEDASSGNITCVSLTQTSSRKVKDNIKPIEDSEKILELDAVSFDYKNKEQGTDKRGFIAEDVAKVLPNLVTPEGETSPATLDYVGMIPYLQDIIKKQEKRIAALEEKINNLGG
ncbi:MAG: phage tail protein [Clostridia bacterium]|nr:phage tail protein [Clostridia bacterium]